VDVGYGLAVPPKMDMESLVYLLVSPGMINITQLGHIELLGFWNTVNGHLQILKFFILVIFLFA